ncbi:MAG: hypothetical protein RSF75_03465, partial [Acidaminococcaceae bacterium]
MKKMSMTEKRQLQEQASRKQWLRRAVCLSLVAGMTWSSGVAMAAGVDYINGQEAKNAGLTKATGLTAGVCTTDYLEDTTTPKNSKNYMTLIGTDVQLVYNYQYATLQARVDHNLGI